MEFKQMLEADEKAFLTFKEPELTLSVLKSGIEADEKAYMLSANDEPNDKELKSIFNKLDRK